MAEIPQFKFDERGPFAVLPLSMSQFAKIDLIDLPRIGKHKWSAQKSRNGFYAVRVENGKKVYMHRRILRCRCHVDHEDHNGLNNRRYNLRHATMSQNIAAARIGGPLRGVYRDKAQPKKWRARITVLGNRIHLGCFVHERQAALAYNRAARKFFGPFARLNRLD